MGGGGRDKSIPVHVQSSSQISSTKVNLWWVSSRDGMGRVILSFREREYVPSRVVRTVKSCTYRQELNRGFNYDHSHK